jgi:hypothetical protein
MEKYTCKQCRYFKSLEILNEKKHNIISGLGHCSHLDISVIATDENCENGKPKKEPKK